jgi:hypothetical protein
MIELFGIPVSVIHGLVVELHTGAAVFAFIALVAMLATDVLFKRWISIQRVQLVRQDADAIAYFGGIFSLFFLIISGITGYLIEPYINNATIPLLLNKELAALGALYFWGVYVFIRAWCGSGLWKKKGLYALEFITSIIAIFFTAIAGSIGGELSAYGESAMDPIYKALGISLKTLTITQADVYITAGILAVITLTVYVFAHLSELPKKEKVVSTSR